MKINQNPATSLKYHPSRIITKGDLIEATGYLLMIIIVFHERNRLVFKSAILPKIEEVIGMYL